MTKRMYHGIGGEFEDRPHALELVVQRVNGHWSQPDSPVKT